MSDLETHVRQLVREIVREELEQQLAEVVGQDNRSPWLSVAEAAIYLRTSEQTVQRLIARSRSATIAPRRGRHGTPCPMSSVLRGLVGRVRFAPVEAWNFLSPRTFLLSMFVGALAGNMVGGAAVAVVVGLAVYVAAALHPRNVTTCRWCGELVYPRATVCRACGRDLA